MDLRKYNYVYNAAAHFASIEKYPEGLTKEFDKKGTREFNALCWALAEMSTQAELVRRDMGYDPHEPLSEEKVRVWLTFRNIQTAREIVLNAIIKGLGKGTEDGEEFDEVLAELEKKTETA